MRFTRRSHAANTRETRRSYVQFSVQLRSCDPRFRCIDPLGHLSTQERAVLFALAQSAGKVGEPP